MVRSTRVSICTLAALTFVFISACSDDGGSASSTDAKVGDGGINRSDAKVDGISGDGIINLTDGTPPTGDGTVATCTINITSINGKAVSTYTRLSSLDDQDKNKTGIQIDVDATVIGLVEGSTASISVTNLTPNPTAKVKDGKASFTGVTVDANLASVTIKPEGCGGSAVVLNIQQDPSCTITAPQDGAKLYSKDDKISGNATFDYDVQVQTKNGISGQIELKVGSASQGVRSPNDFGFVTFPNVVFPAGTGLKLEATVTVGTLSAKCTATVDVDIAAPTCNLSGFDPAATSTSKGTGLGPDQDGDKQTDGLQTTVNVATATGVDKVTLYVDNNELKTLAPTGNNAKFKDITLAEGTRTLKAVCLNSSTKNQGTSQNSVVIVDTLPPPAISDLSYTVTQNRKGEITLVWKSVDDGANGSGVEKYLIHYRSDSIIDDVNFDANDTEVIEPDQTAVPAGQTQTYKTSGLTMPHTYSFAIKGVDYLGNVSEVSNVPAAAGVNWNVQETDGFNANSQFGSRAAVGDYNCDGYSDLAVGEYGANTNTGNVYLYFGSGAGFPATPSKIISGTIAGGKFGYRVAALQFDGDTQKCDDLAVQAFSADGGRGRVYLYLGRKFWPSDRDDVSKGKGAEMYFLLPTTASTNERLGWSITGADFNGDGKSDLVMSHLSIGTVAPDNFGSVLIIYGKSGMTLMDSNVEPVSSEVPTNADVTISGGTYANSFGVVVATGGFLDADQYEDLLIGNHTEKIEGVSRGGVYVVKGAQAATGQEVIDISTASTRVIKISAISSNFVFGNGLVGLGDINGDGTVEFAVTDTGYASGGNAGRVYIFTLGGTTLPASASDAIAIINNDFSQTTDNYLGRHIANGALINPSKGADLNKDGYADIIVASTKTGANNYGSVYLFLGTSGKIVDRKLSAPDYLMSGIDGATSFGFNTIFLTDVNGDGFIDILISEPSYNSKTGRIFLYY